MKQVIQYRDKDTGVRYSVCDYHWVHSLELEILMQLGFHTYPCGCKTTGVYFTPESRERRPGALEIQNKEKQNA
jgi:hypothetical protein